MKLLDAILKVATVLFVAYTASALTRGIILDKSSTYVAVAAVAMTVCIGSTLVHVFRKR